MNWFHQLPHSLVASAYLAGEKAAWSRVDALEVVTFLATVGFVVRGVDIWLPTDPGPTAPVPYVYDWFEGAGRYAGVTAREFIDRFAWDEYDVTHHGMVPVFNITAGRYSAG